MMKTNRFLNMIAASLVGVAFMSCSSDDDALTGSQNAPMPAAQTYTISVTAQKGGEGTRALSLDGTKLNATWKEGEQVAVCNSSDAKIGVLTVQSTGATTTLKGDLTVLPAVSDALTLKFLSSDYNKQDGTLNGTEKSIDKVCDYAVATVTVSGISGTDVATTDATFANQQAVIKFMLKDADGTALPTNPTSFTMTDGTSTVKLTDIPAATYTTNGNGVLYVAFPAKGSSADISLTATVGEYEYTCDKTGVTFNNSKYYGETVRMLGEIAGDRFTINGSGNKVAFSQGNLQATYNSGKWTWKFADHQWDYIGNAAGNTSVTDSSPFISQNATVDLFGWVGASTTMTAEAAIHGINSAGPYPSVYGSSATEALKSDWGNTISDGNPWRTLTGGPGGEWDYIFSNRASGATVNGVSNARWTHATINTDNGSDGIKGMILFPDGCRIFSGSVTTWGAINGTSAYATKCTTAQWTHLEELGCVFLPAAGRRNGTSVDFAGTDGYYWSSSPGSAGFYYAYCVRFYSNRLDSPYEYYRLNGYSVRLVRDVQ